MPTTVSKFKGQGCNDTSSHRAMYIAIKNGVGGSRGHMPSLVRSDLNSRDGISDFVGGRQQNGVRRGESDEGKRCCNGGRDQDGIRESRR